MEKFFEIDLSYIFSSRFLNTTSNTTSGNLTSLNSTSNATDKNGTIIGDEKPDDSGGSILSAWYIWLGIILAVLLVFGMMALMWHQTRDPNAGPIQWCQCFKRAPSEDPAENLGADGKPIQNLEESTN
jgi:hypothetical protein